MNDAPPVSFSQLFRYCLGQNKINSHFLRISGGNELVERYFKLIYSLWQTYPGNKNKNYKIVMTQNYELFDHPLNDDPVIVEVDGKQFETINTWTFAAMILEVICNPLSPLDNPSGLRNATEMASSSIKKANPDINFDKLIQRCKDNNEAALRQAHSLIANGIGMLADEQFNK
jgi:hypothetical protein